MECMAIKLVEMDMYEDEERLQQVQLVTLTAEIWSSHKDNVAIGDTSVYNLERPYLVFGGNKTIWAGTANTD